MNLFVSSMGAGLMKTWISCKAHLMFCVSTALQVFLS